MSDATTLINDLSQTETDVDHLKPYVEKVDKALSEAIEVAEIPEKVADKLGTLAKDLQIVDDALLVLTPVPVVGEGAAPAEKAVSTLRKPVDAVNKKAQAFEKRVKPIREKLQAADKRVKQLIDGLTKLKTCAGKGKYAVSGVKDCVVGHTKLENGLNKFCKATDPTVKGVNQVLEAATAVAEQIQKALGHLSDVGKAMKPVEKAIDDVMKTLKDLEVGLKPIQAALNQKISFPYSFKVKLGVTWKKKWGIPYPVPHFGMKTVNYTFTIHQVLDGIHGVIGFVQDGLMSLAKKALAAVNLKLPTIGDIPGLKELEAKIDAAMAPLEKLKEDLEELEAKAEQILKSLHALEVSVEGFHIECP